MGEVIGQIWGLQEFWWGWNQEVGVERMVGDESKK